ncbi:DNA primase lrg domain containing protein [Trichuris trichiura]|uniref:DNA primase lrg domain containing protein n=1 Tax=Trichuris trichiura TaxID=36087 RepID=A0A077Z1T6_TRITR|nr:DNA primase lrg domain containing protein [Trichuris trichiura]
MELLLRWHGTEGADFTIEQSRKDVLSHFLLSSLLFDEQWSWTFLRKAELGLFKLRISLLTNKELVKSLRHLYRDSKSFVHLSRDFSDTLTRLKHFGFDQFVETCRTMGTKSFSPIVHLLVPFTAVLELVSRRMVRLQRGLAFVTADCFDHVMAFLFTSCMEMRRNCSNTRRPPTLDERLLFIASEVKAFIKSACPESCSVVRPLGETFLVSSEQVDTLQSILPPCMLHLHKQLRSSHRLCHHARIQYTLFLKDIGMSIEESLKFWSAEFGIPCKDLKSSCRHNWSTEQRRYTYNILHLHGLVGSRKNYSCRTCESLQVSKFTSDLTFLASDCGCPFRYFDDKKLEQFLLSSYPLSLNLITYILEKRAQEHYNDSCLLVKRAVCTANAIPPSILSAAQSFRRSLSCNTFHLKLSSNSNLSNANLSDHKASLCCNYAEVNKSISSLGFTSPVVFFTDVLSSISLSDSDVQECMNP